MSDISLLPQEEARKREQALPSSQKSSSPSGDLRMHIPEADVDEDIEIIEVDEGDLGTVLADEPFLTRFMYRASTLVDQVQKQLFHKEQTAPPPKLPPQFFTPPRSGAAGAGRLPPGVTEVMAGKGVPAGAGKVRARITPSADVPRRVRVVKRVRKPVQVSLISEEAVLAYRVDIPRRKWTLAVMIVLFSSLIGGGYWLLNTRTAAAQASVTEIDRQIAEIETTTLEAESTWSEYGDLQSRLTVLGGLLDEHVVLSRMFDLLEKRTIPTVAFRGATLNAQNVLILDAVADSYDSAAKQLVAFQTDPIVLRAESTSFSSQIDGEKGASTVVTFQLLVTLDPDALRGPLATTP